MEDPYYTDSIVRPGCTHFRLRNGRAITGYMQINPNQSVYYSKDNFWWRSTPIDFSETDRSTEMFDANRQMIFEHDLVRQRKQGKKDYTKIGLITWVSDSDGFVINLLEEDQILPFAPANTAAPFRDDLKITGQLFDS